MHKIKPFGFLLALSLCVAIPASAHAAPRHEKHEKKDKNKTRNTLIGAGLGMLGGALLSKGDPWATVAGAAAGGAIGNVTSKDKGKDRRWSNRERDRWDRRDRGLEDRHNRRRSSRKTK